MPQASNTTCLIAKNINTATLLSSCLSFANSVLSDMYDCNFLTIQQVQNILAKTNENISQLVQPAIPLSILMTLLTCHGMSLQLQQYFRNINASNIVKICLKNQFNIQHTN